MLISKSVMTKWNSRTKLYYESLGYSFTKMGDKFEVLVSHLKDSSCERVLVMCDYCGKINNVIYHHYLKSSKNKYCKKDTCHDCAYLKARESNLAKYGVVSCMKLEPTVERLKQSMLAKYGVENPFQNEEIKEKIKNVFIERYGVDNPNKSSEIISKRRKTCLEKYGEDHYMKTKKYKEMFSGSKNPRWKGGIKDFRFERVFPEYKLWRNGIYGRDFYTCQKCGNFHCDLECHHIFNFKDYPELRYDENNGITFCKECHIEFHKIFGKSFNNDKQLELFLQNEDKKICRTFKNNN